MVLISLLERWITTPVAQSSLCKAEKNRSHFEEFHCPGQTKADSGKLEAGGTAGCCPLLKFLGFTPTLTPTSPSGCGTWW